MLRSILHKEFSQKAKVVFNLYHRTFSNEVSSFEVELETNHHEIKNCGVYGWGHNDRGQLGQGEKEKIIEPIKKLDYHNIFLQDNKKLKINQIVAQEDGSIFIAMNEKKENFFYGVGVGLYGISGFLSDDPVFTPIPFQNPENIENPLTSKFIKQISKGRFHVLYLTGLVFLFLSF